MMFSSYDKFIGMNKLIVEDHPKLKSICNSVSRKHNMVYSLKLASAQVKETQNKAPCFTLSHQV